MALKIRWTPRADKGFDQIVEYLEKKWTKKEVKSFAVQTFDFLDKLSMFPKLLKPSNKKNIRRGPINKHTILTYRVNYKENQIELLNIRSSRKKPLK